MRPKALVFLAIVLAFASNGLAQSSAYEVAHPGSAPYSPDRGTPTAAAYQGDQTSCPPDNNSFYSNSTYDVPSIDINSASSLRLEAVLHRSPPLQTTALRPNSCLRNS
jgi:hypothetical protein